jgi:hypothetical protein
VELAADERLSRLHIDGVPRTYRDRQEFAIEAARRLMTKYPHTVTVNTPRSRVELILRVPSGRGCHQRIAQR